MEYNNWEIGKVYFLYAFLSHKMPVQDSLVWNHHVGITVNVSKKLV